MGRQVTDQTLAALLVLLGKKFQPKIKQTADKITVTTYDGKVYTLQLKNSSSTRSTNIRNR